MSYVFYTNHDCVMKNNMYLCSMEIYWKSNHTLTAILIAMLMVSCTESKEARELFAHVESVMEEHPDSALALMESAHIDHARLSSDVEGKYALLYTMAQDKSGIDVDDDSLIRIAYDYYKDRTEDSLYAKSQYYMGCYYNLCDSTYSAEMCFNHAIDKGKASKDYETAYMACYQLSSSLVFSNTDKAIKIAKEGLCLLEKHDKKNIKNNIFLQLNLAETYLYTTDKQNKALPCLYSAKELANSLKDSTLVGYVCHALSCGYMRLEQNDSALFYAEECTRLAKESDESSNILYAVTLFNTDSIAHASEMFYQIAKSAESPNVIYTCYRHILEGELKKSNQTNLLLTFDSLTTSINSMYENSMQLRNDYYEANLQKEKENTMLAEKSKKKDICIIIAISVGLLAIFIITFLYIYSKKESKRKMQLEHHHHLLELQHQEEENRRERELEEQKHKLDMEAAEKRHQDEITMRELQLNIMRDNLLSKLAFMKKISKTRDDNKAIRLTNEDWKEIETFLNGVDYLFVERIKEEFPNLKEKDLQFCMLLRLKCSTQDLMNIYCINEQSVKHKKYLFKEKLGIQGEETSAFQFISNY